MTSELSNFAARLRQYIFSEGRISQGLESRNANQDGDSCNSSLRKEDAFNALALELFALQFEHNGAYRKIAESRGMAPRTATHWSQIPAVPAAAFKELELTCLAPAQHTHVFHSSGTPEQQRPSRHFHHLESLSVYEASLWKWFKQHVLTDLRFTIYDLRLAILTPPPAQAPCSSLVHMFESVRCALGAPEPSFFGRTDDSGSWELDFDSATGALNSAGSGKLPLLLLGTAFSFVHLLDFLSQLDSCFALPPGSRVMETGGYKGRSRSLPKAELHALITERLGVPPSHIVCEYGMSELSSQAYDKMLGPEDVAAPHPDPLPQERGNHRQAVGDTDTMGNSGSQTSPLPLLLERAGVRAEQSAYRVPATRSFHFPPWARVQIVSPETGHEVADGETGLIRVFDLANVFSVMAVQTEDLGIRRGHGFELVGRAELTEPRGCSLLAV